jgi:hypothetical protein
MGDQHKSEVVSEDFGIQSFWGGHGKILPRPGLMPKGTVCPEIPNSETGRVPITVTHKSLTFGAI